MNDRTVGLARLLLMFAFAALPLFPTFITLSAVAPPGISLLPPVVVVGLLCVSIAAAVAMMILLKRTTVPPDFWPVATYLGGWAVAALCGLDPKTGALIVVDGLFMVPFYLGVRRYYAELAPWLYVAFLTSGFGAAVLGIALVVLRRPVELYAISHGRATSTFIVPGEFAGYLLLLVPTGAGVALCSRQRPLRALAVAAVLAGLVALGLTYSRAGWVGLAAGTAFALAITRRSIRFRTIVGLSVVVGSIAIVSYTGHHNPSENFTRLGIWWAGLRTVELFPLTGVGPGSFRHIYPLLRPPAGVPTAFHAHSYPLTALAETGIIGGGTLVVMWWTFVSAVRRRWSNADSSARTLAGALAVGFVATWAQGVVDYVQVLVLGCWLPFMALTLGAAEHGLAER